MITLTGKKKKKKNTAILRVIRNWLFNIESRNKFFSYNL